MGQAGRGGRSVVHRATCSQIGRAGADPPAVGLLTKSRALCGDFEWRKAVSAPEHAGG
jgi:hypothetical protein